MWSTDIVSIITTYNRKKEILRKTVKYEFDIKCFWSKMFFVSIFLVEKVTNLRGTPRPVVYGKNSQQYLTVSERAQESKSPRVLKIFSSQGWSPEKK